MEREEPCCWGIWSHRQHRGKSRGTAATIVLDPIIILGQSKSPEEREFYLRMAIQKKWSSRELERQFKAALFERSVTQPASAEAISPCRSGSVSQCLHDRVGSRVLLCRL